MSSLEPSSSSLRSSSAQKRKENETEKIGQEKKSKQDDELLDEAGKEEKKQEQKQVEDESLIGKLPNEMLMEIFKYVNTKDLISCRFVSRVWNGAASKILRSREDMEFEFDCYKSVDRKLVQSIQSKKRGKSLMDFVECFSQSKNFPFSRFLFAGAFWSTFARKDWFSFVCSFQENVKCLKLSFMPFDKETVCTKSVMVKLAKNVKDVLLRQFPDLEEFGIHLYERDFLTCRWSTIPLFPKPKSKTTAKTSKTTAKTTTTTTKVVELPHLKALYVHEFFSAKFAGIVADLLEAAVNLQKIEGFGYTNFKLIQISDYPLLHSLGKLGCVDKLKVFVVPEELSDINEKCPTFPGLKLKKLDLFLWYLYKKRESDQSFWPSARVFLLKLLESSKDSLVDMKMDPLGFLDGLQLPGLNSLANLTIVDRNERHHQDFEINEAILPLGVQLNDVFPALHSFECFGVPWTGAFPSDSSPVPTLTCLKINGTRVSQSSIVQIAEMFPNLKKFTIGDFWGLDSVFNFPPVARAIWTHMKQLVYLYIQICYWSPANAFPAVDSCITGFSREFTMYLHELHKREEKSSQIDGTGTGTQVLIPQSRLDAERTNPSILDLKDLRRLNLRFMSDTYGQRGVFREWRTEVVETQKKMAITCVSEKYAFGLMDKLQSRRPSIW